MTGKHILLSLVGSELEAGKNRDPRNQRPTPDHLVPIAIKIVFHGYLLKRLWVRVVLSYMTLAIVCIFNLSR